MDSYIINPAFEPYTLVTDVAVFDGVTSVEVFRCGKRDYEIRCDGPSGLRYYIHGIKHFTCTGMRT